jgi:hypothetical protein
MPNKYNGLSAQLQKVIDLGLIDSWMRGAAQLAPHAGAVAHKEFDTHVLYVGTCENIGNEDISATVGFRQLLTTCSQHDVKIDITALSDGHLCVAFDASKDFTHSRVFGARYTNVLPVLFGKNDGLKG